MSQASSAVPRRSTAYDGETRRRFSGSSSILATQVLEADCWSESTQQRSHPVSPR